METKQANQAGSILNAISAATKLLKGSQLKAEVLESISPYLSQISEYLGVSQNQAIIFTTVFELQLDDDYRDPKIGKVSGYLDLPLMDVLGFVSDFEGLKEKNLFNLKRNSKSEVPLLDDILSIPDYIRKAILLNEPIPEVPLLKLPDIYTFVKKISDLIAERRDDTLTSYQLFQQVEECEEVNTHLEVIPRLNQLGLSIEERTLMYEMCDDLFSYSGITGLDCTLSDIFDNRHVRLQWMRKIKDQESRLSGLELIKLCRDEFIQDAKLEFTEKGLELLLKEDAELFIRKADTQSLILAEKIQEKKLYFGEQLNKEISFLSNCLQNSHFSSLQERMEKQALPKGIAVMLYGSPGTGKTETVYQLAKQTGRNIMHVDISQTKSMWFGESEKKIKEVFANYARFCKNAELKPILLFNEADAVFGKRKDSNSSNVAQTENAIQNIILEELEKLDGILIATTNLNQNLDAAFERRFLFKIRFEKPELEAKQRIWQSKLDWLSDSEALRLAEYSFSGGEIDNITRKAIMDEVLTGNRPSMESLLEYCQHERFSGTESKKIGYK